jgi:hypothetical protein
VVPGFRSVVFGVGTGEVELDGVVVEAAGVVAGLGVTLGVAALVGVADLVTTGAGVVAWVDVVVDLDVDVVAEDGVEPGVDVAVDAVAVGVGVVAAAGPATAARDRPAVRVMAASAASIFFMRFGFSSGKDLLGTHLEATCDGAGTTSGRWGTTSY